MGADVSSDIHPQVWTAGHSTRPIGEFIALLQSATIAIVGDVRRFPGSRRYPQYNQSALAETLATEGMDYVALADLGGRREPHPDSPHTAWRNPSFRGYADYMDTDPFRHGADRIISLAGSGRIALMCSSSAWRSIPSSPRALAKIYPIYPRSRLAMPTVVRFRPSNSMQSS